MASIHRGPRVCHTYRPLRLGGVGSGPVVPLDDDRLVRCARIGARGTLRKLVVAFRPVMRA
eukprot:1211836-Prymnesium_polylepis.2